MAGYITFLLIKLFDFGNDSVEVRDNGIDDGQLRALQDVSPLLVQVALFHNLALLPTLFQTLFAFLQEFLKSLAGLHASIAGTYLTDTTLEGTGAITQLSVIDDRKDDYDHYEQQEEEKLYLLAMGFLP